VYGSVKYSHAVGRKHAATEVVIEARGRRQHGTEAEAEGGAGVKVCSIGEAGGRWCV